MADYRKVDPSTYIQNGRFDSSELVGIPIKLGFNEVMELFDDITKQLIEKSLVQITSMDNRTYIEFRDDSNGFPVSKIVEDKGEGVIVTFNESGTLSLYDDGKNQNLKSSEIEYNELDELFEV